MGLYRVQVGALTSSTQVPGNFGCSQDRDFPLILGHRISLCGMDSICPKSYCSYYGGGGGLNRVLILSVGKHVGVHAGVHAFSVTQYQ